MFHKIHNCLQKVEALDTEYAIVCDDDFVPIPNFLAELNKTVALLPPQWRCLHLCPGYLWGRRFRDFTKVGHMNPEYDLSGIAYHASGRFFHRCHGDVYSRRRFWLGGPVAFLVKKSKARDFMDDFVSRFTANKLPDDVVFTQMLNPDKDFICREPMLGYEDEVGGSTYRSSSSR